MMHCHHENLIFHFATFYSNSVFPNEIDFNLNFYNLIDLGVLKLSKS